MSGYALDSTTIDLCLTEGFKAMLARLDDGFKRTRDFTLPASHELKTPLTILRSEMETALRGSVPVRRAARAVRSGLSVPSQPTTVPVRLPLARETQSP